MLTEPASADAADAFTDALLRDRGFDRNRGDELVFVLCGSDGSWVDACAAAARAGDPAIARFCSPDGPRTWIIRTIAKYGPDDADTRALAVCHAAHAVQLTGAGETERARSALLRAAELWAGAGTPVTLASTHPPMHDDPIRASLLAAHPGLPWTEVYDLVGRLDAGTPEPKPATHMTVLLDDQPDTMWGDLHAEAVTGLGEVIWPSPVAMAFSPVPPALREATEQAFRWARAHENFTPGTGIRWWLTDDRGRPAGTATRMAAAMAVTIAHEARLRKRAGRLDPRAAILAGMDPGGRLRPVAAVPAIGSGRVRTLLLADEQEPVVTGDGVRERRVRTVDQAVSAGREPRPRRVAVTVAALTALVVLVAGLVFWQVGVGRAARERTTLATQLASAARSAPPSQQVDGIRKALAALAVQPGSKPARDTLLATALADLRRLRLLDVGAAAGHRRVVLDAHGTRVAVADDRGLSLWDVTTGSRLPLDVPSGATVTAVGFGPQEQLVTAAADGTLTLYTAAGRVAARRSVHPAPTALTVVPRGDAVAVGDAGGTVTLHDLRDLTPRRSLRTTAGNAIASIGFTTDGGHVAATGSGRTVHTWRIDGTEARRAPLTGPGSFVDYDNTNTYVRVLSAPSRFSVFTAADMTLARVASALVGSPGIARHHGTNDLLIAASNSVMEVNGWPSEKKGPLTQSLTGGGVYARGALVDNVIATSEDGKRLVTQLDEATLVVYADIEVTPSPWPGRPQLIAQVWDLPDPRRQLAVTGFALGNTQVYTVDRDSRAKIDGGAAEGSAKVYRAAYSPVQHLVAVPLNSTATVGLWSVTDDGMLTGIPARFGVGEAPTAVAFDDVHRTLLVGYRRRLVTYDMTDPREPRLRLDQQLEHTITCLSVDPPASAVVTCGAGGLRRLPLDDGGLPDGSGAADPLVDSRRIDEAVAVSATTVIAGSRNGTSYLYRQSSGRWQVIPLKGHGGVSTSVNATGGMLVSAGDDGTLVISDGTTGATLATSQVGRTNRTSGISVAGSTVRIHDSIDGDRIDLDLSPQAVQRRACDLLGSASARLTVADAAADTPDEYRTLALCPAPR
ncbi:WD40 repeat domain-containing protein [Actinoplanes awajinensis]|uniref:Uncharacterized protein n=1 Tax=Actinoplanes awajinensis subsp. mycoplanecinus TaxID=135947 RepID=A0A117MQ18_9ACTN|nr:WD40 repeat domain-containing protein [Actinoplanes awajinensis]KUL29439.1 hypothetical protein ADL15_27875 [Actinoplanes awajinensis subsp. mycoplanecinus]